MILTIAREAPGCSLKHYSFPNVMGNRRLRCLGLDDAELDKNGLTSGQNGSSGKNDRRVQLIASFIFLSLCRTGKDIQTSRRRTAG